MLRLSIVCCFVGFLAAFPVDLAAQKSSTSFSLDALLDWNEPFGQTRADFEKAFPIKLSKDGAFQLSPNRNYKFDNRDGDAGVKMLWLKDKFEVVHLTVALGDRSGIWEWWLRVRLAQGDQPAWPEVQSALTGMVGTPPAVTGQVEKPVYLWTHTRFLIEGNEMSDGFVYLKVKKPGSEPTPASSSVAKQMPELSADLDFLLMGGEVWKWSVDKFRESYTAKADNEKDQQKPPQFEWLTAARDRARFSRKMFSNVETRLTMFDGSVKVEEAIVEFVDGRIARATVSFYNRGDTGEITVSAFETLSKKIGQNLVQAFQASPRSQAGAANAVVKSVGWNWTTANTIALLEYNSPEGGAKPEFLRLKLASPAQADWSMGRLSVGVQRMALTRNIMKAGNGDLFVANVPMVDQGAKGYCVAASCQRLFEYMQIPCDQHELAQLLNVDAKRGTNPLEMQKSLAKVDSRFGVAFKPLINPEIYYDNRGKRRVSLKEFAGIVQDHVNKGVPLLWALELGRYKEEPPLSGGGQTGGGHMRMIIGYNQAENKVLFTDSWGAGHELKRMDATDAYEATLGLYSMSPRGL